MAPASRPSPERFYRVGGTQAEGSGLGLAIVREVAERHGAQVAVLDGADGQGARFVVDFPPPQAG